ncbi:Neuron navigator 2 [Liparis tanakae]|uniref:Neuron navigator 2 n=1 Tax=Liparis tanakae TaxID=230148 RepID=A0A4Z2GZ98_9TELE|nr:Neuron navigator 2 [Liparis tanakae]
MTEHAPSSVGSSTSIPAATSGQIPPPSSLSSPSSSSSSSTAIPQPSSSSSSKPWRSKSVSSKHISPSASSSTGSGAASAAPSVKQEKAEAPPKAVAQKSMLEKLKLFNSKGSSKSSASSNGAGAQSDGAAALARQLEAARVEAGSNTEPLEEDDGNVRPGMNGTGNGAAPPAGTSVPTTASSPKIALRGIAQRTFSRALTAKKGSIKSTEKDKEKGKEKEKEKEKGKEAGKRISAPERTELRGDEPKEEAAPVAADADSANKRTSKITSFIPKGGKVAKKESSTPAHSGIPKPGGKAPAVGGKASSSAKEAGERPRSMRLGGGLGLHRGPLDRDRDSRHSSSTSSLASTEGKSSASPVAGGGSTQSTASNTISVQLPQTQQHHSHPNTATVAPFMYR